MCKHYQWPHDFWRKMGRRQFYAWVEQIGRETGNHKAGVDRWEDTDADDWWEKARRKRDEALGR
jgi:hypothetical protein